MTILVRAIPSYGGSYYFRLHEVLDRKWPNIALFAYNQFLEHGRGIVALEHFDADGRPDSAMQYVVYPETRRDAKIASLLDSYDPDSEVLLHYMDNKGRFHTSRVHEGDSINPKIVRRLVVQSCSVE